MPQACELERVAAAGIDAVLVRRVGVEWRLHDRSPF